MFYRWWIVAPVALFFMVDEFEEDLANHFNWVSLFKVCALSISFALIIWLVELLYRSMKNQERAVQTMDYKRQISLELMGCDDWLELTDRIVRIPADIGPVREACLYLFNAHTHQYDPLSRWVAGSGKTALALEADDVCASCHLQKLPGGKHACAAGMVGLDTADSNLPHCIPLTIGTDSYAMIRFDLQPGMGLTVDQKYIFEQISGEMATALKAGQDRKQLAEIRAAEAGQAERRRVTRFLHDHLGQNMGFLRLKLDQLIVEGPMVMPDLLHKDLSVMLQVANESYDIVRGTIEDIHSRPGLSVTELLRQHVWAVAQQSGLEVEFQVQGQAGGLHVEVQREVFYVFREALSNIVRHARAKHIEIFLAWHESTLDIDIRDDGIGFNPAEIDTAKHFGLGIMADRLASINGQFGLNAQKNTGTLVSLHVPIIVDQRAYAVFSTVV